VATRARDTADVVEDVNVALGSKVDYPSGGADGNVLTKSGTAAAWSAVPQAGLTLITSDTFSAVSTLDINNCFTSTYAVYRVLLTNLSLASGSDIRVRAQLRTGGSPNSTSNYQDGRRGISNGGAFDQNFTGGKTSWEFISNLFSGTDTGFTSFDLYNPQLATRTGYTAFSVTTDAFQLTAGRFNADTTFDGITLFPASSTFSGTIRIYGYGN
jgi:hypothetical protein